MLKVVALVAVLMVGSAMAWGTMPSVGVATATKYAVQSSFINGATGACNCKTATWQTFPTAALNEWYFGASTGGGAGQACGRCYKLKMYGTVEKSGYCTDNGPEMVVKVNNLCPREEPNTLWCSGSEAPNSYGFQAHFDLDERYTGNFETASGTGNWKVQYCQVSCDEWAGYSLGGAVDGTQTSEWGKCPLNPQPEPPACTFTPQCSGISTPEPVASSGSSTYTITWNGGSNSYWLAFNVSPAASSNPTINCGAGFKATTACPWGEANCYVWASSDGSQCASNVQINVNGQIVSSVRP